MTIGWEAWEKLRGSLDYSWTRMQELDPRGNRADREEYESLVEQALANADRLVQYSGSDVPALDTTAARERWETASRTASVLRERIVEHRESMRSLLEEADGALADE